MFWQIHTSVNWFADLTEANEINYISHSFATSMAVESFDMHFKIVYNDYVGSPTVSPFRCELGTGIAGHVVTLELVTVLIGWVGS